MTCHCVYVCVCGVDALDKISRGAWSAAMAVQVHVDIVRWWPDMCSSSTMTPVAQIKPIIIARRFIDTRGPRLRGGACAPWPRHLFFYFHAARFSFPSRCFLRFLTGIYCVVCLCEFKSVIIESGCQGRIDTY